MIFVTVGTQLPFDRLIRAVDQWASNHDIKGFAQIGPGQYLPQHLRYSAFIEPQQFLTHLEAADCVISHAGMGTILSAVTHAKPAILMPRMATLGEHRNEHQLATARKFGSHPLIKIANNAKEVGEAYASIMANTAAIKPQLSMHANPEFIEALRKLIF